MNCCPGCHCPYLKDEKCEHVKCEKPGCEVEFCFTCSAFREPTMEHGCHYHRPSCRFYTPFDKRGDKYTTKCFKCREKGTLCDRPKDLIKKGRFQPGEI